MTTDTKPLAERLRHASTTASNDDLSKPGTEKRQRHADRVAVMLEAADDLDAKDALLREAAKAPACLSAAADQFDRMPVRDPEQWVLWGMSSSHPGYPSKQITVGDARRARSLLSKLTEATKP